METQPKTPGPWLVRSKESPQWLPVVIANSEQGLLVHRPIFGPVLLDEYHASHTDIEWRQPVKLWGTRRGIGR